MITEVPPPPALRSARLRFRALARSDSPMLFETWTSDPETVRYLQWKPHSTLEETERWVIDCLRTHQAGEKYYFVVSEARTGNPVGFCSLQIELGFRAALGFVVFRGNRGNGYALEMIRAGIESAFARPEIHRVYCLCDADNLASVRAMTKAGMKREGILRRWAVHPNVSAQPRDVICFAQVKLPA